MTDMTLEQLRDSLQKLSKVRMDYVELRAMADAIDAHLAKAGQPYAYEYWVGNGDGTRSQELGRRLPSYHYSDWGVAKLYAAPPAQTDRDYKAEMKNFHRSLCDRFGYAHDDVDWFRDQVSLEEFIAKRFDAALANPRPTGDVLIIPQDPLPSSIDALNQDDPNIARAAMLAFAKREMGETYGAGQFQFSTYATAPTGDVVSLLAEAKTKLARAVGTAEAGPSKLWKHDVNSAAWDIARAMDVLAATTGEQAGEVVELLRKGFITSQSCGPDNHYQLVVKFQSLAELQRAHNAIVMYPESAQPRPVGVPDGWILMPCEATWEMIDACHNEGYGMSAEAYRVLVGECPPSPEMT